MTAPDERASVLMQRGAGNRFTRKDGDRNLDTRSLSKSGYRFVSCIAADDFEIRHYRLRRTKRDIFMRSDKKGPWKEIDKASYRTTAIYELC